MNDAFLNYWNNQTLVFIDGIHTEYTVWLEYRGKREEFICIVERAPVTLSKCSTMSTYID